MQLNKHLSVISILSTPLLCAANTDSISLKHSLYQEDNDRIKVHYTGANFSYEIGNNYNLKINLNHDSISGGTPVWDTKSGASGFKERADLCIYNAYLCQNTHENDLITLGKFSMLDFIYHNKKLQDKRTAGGFNISKKMANQDEIALGANYSKESDFKSFEASFSYLHNLDKLKNHSLSLAGSYQLNDVKFKNKQKDFTIINAQMAYNVILSKNLQASFGVFGILQKGTLSNPYQRIIRYFNAKENENKRDFRFFLAHEKRPENRKSFGFSGNFALLLNEKNALHGKYRFYGDDWDIYSHAITLSLHSDITSKISLMPFARFYTQTKANFYKSYDGVNFLFNKSQNGSNDERLSQMHSLSLGLGGAYKFTQNLSFNADFMHQNQSTGLKSALTSLGLNYNF